MIMKTIRLVSLLISLCFIACTSEKDKYLDRYQRFATDVVMNAQTYTEQDWEIALSTYEQLKNEYIQYSRDMTVEDRMYIEELNETINKMFVRNVATDTFEGLKNLFGDLSDMVEEFLFTND